MKNEDLVLLFQTPNVGGTVGNREIWNVLAPKSNSKTSNSNPKEAFLYKRVGFVFFNIHTLITDLQTTPNTDQR